jgi:hypothetical protein
MKAGWQIKTLGEIYEIERSGSSAPDRQLSDKRSRCIHDGWLVLRQRYLKVNQDYLYHVLSSGLVFQQFDQLAAGSDEISMETRHLSTLCQRKLAALDELKKSLLHQAFNGDL